MTRADYLSAIDILTRLADDTRACHTVNGTWDDDALEAKAEHDECLRLVSVMQVELGDD